jgi:hypothetical protein
MMDGHHLILGKTTDYITGEIIDETHDERYRQKIARLLVEDCLYDKKDITPRHEILVKAGNKGAKLKIDFLISCGDRICIIIKYGPGSITTRHRPALAASRITVPYQIPLVVVTNGVDADILDGQSGRIVSTGLSSIPDKASLINISDNYIFSEIKPDRAEIESRILYAYEVDGSCPCDDTICRIDDCDNEAGPS